MSACVKRAKVGASSSLASIASGLTSWAAFTAQVCLVSHHGQPTAQPCRRTNTDGVPACRASPWMDSNTSLTANVSDMIGRAALAGLIHLHANKPHRRAGQQVRPDLRDEIRSDVLGSGIERHGHYAGVDGSQRFEQKVVMRMADYPSQ